MRRRTRSVADLHEDWLTQVETEGPFLALPVIKDIWPDGVDRLGDTDDRMVTFKQAFVTWQHQVDAFAYADRTPEAKERYAAVTRAWIETVLDDLAGWDGLRVTGDDLPSTLEIRSPGEQVAVRPSGALKGRDADYGALLLISPPTTSLRETGLDGWAANEIDRMAMLLRKAQVEVGIVTDGQWWAIVWAKDGKPTGSGMVNALTWAEEPLSRDAFLTLIDQRRFRAKDAEQRLPRLFERSELEAEEITEALGTQVRRSVELLVQAFSEARLEAVRNGDPDPLAEDPDEVYQAAVTVMMRVVFLLFAEEREILPTEQLYWDSYAIRDLLTDLKQHAANGEEPLDESFDAWHRLLAVSQALYAGVNYDEMRMPAYGGSLLDPDRFPWLHATDRRGLRLKVSDRVMMHMLESVQTALVRGERRRVSFRDIDVEQIGYIYEGLLGYSCKVVENQVVLGLVGREGEEPEVDAGTLQWLYDDNPGAAKFTAALLAWIKTDQPAAKPWTSARMKKLYDAEVDEADMRRLLTPIAGPDEDLLGFLIDWSNYIRKDLRGIPLVVPVGGLMVVETPSRKNAGAHYTPRSLAEEIVLHALQPLVYDPGPLQLNDEIAWRLKSSSAILDLKVADIAAGSGAFLVAAARYLADRVTEAWITEGRLDSEQVANPQLAKDQAIREVIARCLYGADINPMAVEMCKLSLWLVSMDKTKPFTFVDDKIFCGNSLLGVTSLDQLRYLHIYPDSTSVHAQLLVDIDGKITEATRLRRELASPVEEHDPMRSTRGKLALLKQLRRVTADLRLVADGIIAAGLPLGGKPGGQLDDAYSVLSWELSEAFPSDGLRGDFAKLEKRIEAGLTPTVETDYKRWHPLHWVIETPDVMIERNGFDAIIGNPPFLRISAQTAAMGANVRDFVVEAVADGVRGMADFVAYFFRRAAQLAGDSGTVGLIATNSIAQNHSSRVGIEPLILDGWSIYYALKSRPWPGQANFHYSHVTLTRRPLRWRYLEGMPVAGISALLDEDDGLGTPAELPENSGLSFEGFKLAGESFILSATEAYAILTREPLAGSVVRPYLVTEDITSRPGESPSRWAIDFGTMSLEQAQQYPAPFAVVEERVFPKRRDSRRRSDREYWWRYGETRPGLRFAMRGLRHVVVIGALAKWLTVSRQPTNVIFSNRLIVVANETFTHFAQLCSSLYENWVRDYAGRLEDRLAYSPTTAYRTYPFVISSARLENEGEEFNSLRSGLLSSRLIGLNALGNLLHNPSIVDDDIRLLRDAIRRLDRAIVNAYGWQDLELKHGFYDSHGIVRFTMSPATWAVVKRRLHGQIAVRLSDEGVPERSAGASL